MNITKTLQLLARLAVDKRDRELLQLAFSLFNGRGK